jgi:HEAT repeat protein
MPPGEVLPSLLCTDSNMENSALRTLLVLVACSILVQLNTLSSFALPGRKQRDQEISRLVRGLHQSQDPAIIDMDREWRRAVARNRLVAIGSRSRKLRARVIKCLTAALRNPDPKYASDWEGACDVFGRLKATEAIDLLIERLDWTRVPSSSMSSPGVDALMVIGQLSVPKLAEALLRTSTSPAVRYYGTVALGEIGGPRARDALNLALKVETERGIKQTMEEYLRKLTRSLSSGASVR